MTITAQGAKMRCDHAGCTQTATVERDAWAFCAAHAGTPQPRPSAPAARPDRLPAAAPTQAATITEAAATGPGPIGLLLEQATGHSSKRVQNLASKIETEIDRLRALVADLAEDEKRKQAERVKKEKARQDIVRLEQQLAAARAELRGAPKPKNTTAGKTGGGSAGRVLEQLPCRKGCDTICNGPAGRSAHERHCAGAA